MKYWQRKNGEENLAFKGMNPRISYSIAMPISEITYIKATLKKLFRLYLYI